MKEVFGDAWDLIRNYTYLCITTNGFIKNNGTAVMGRGIAAEFARRYSSAPRILAKMMMRDGNVVNRFGTSKYIAFPVKHNWWEKGDIPLIRKSCIQLMRLLKDGDTVLLPRPGCGNGKLDWNVVKPLIEPLLDDRVHIVHWKK